MHGDPLMEVTDAMPEDVVLLHDALQTIHSQLPTKGRNETTTLHSKLSTLNLRNAGTAYRFLTAYCAQLPGCEVVLDGCERMHHRPIGPLVEVLRTLGAKIDYLGEEGFPPLRIIGTTLNTVHRTPNTVHQTLNTNTSSQFASALELIGIPCDAPPSPYLTMTRTLVQNYQIPNTKRQTPNTKHQTPEQDWSSAAFWYEYVALHGGEIEMQGLSSDSIQGDRVVADIFEQLGVDTLYINAGVCVRGTNLQTPDTKHQTLNINFSSCPDLYPAVAMTCKALGYHLQATGIENLRYKESDRVTSVEAMLSTPQGQMVMTEHDHRIAMAAMVAGYKVDDEDCVNKSYPNFKRELCKLLFQGEA